MSYSGNDEISPFIVMGGGEENTLNFMTPVIIKGFIGLVVLIILYYVYISLTTKNEETPSDTITTQPCKEECWTKTAAVGGSGGSPYDFKCPDGQYVDKVYYRAGSGLDQIGVRCSGSKLDEATSNLYGGNGGNPGSFEFANGIDSFYVTGDSLVGNINPGTNSVVDFTKGGKASGSWSGETKQLKCSPGSKISGIYGSSGTVNDKLGFNCYKFA